MRFFKLFASMLLLLFLSIPVLSRPKGESTVVGCLVVDLTGSYPKRPGPVYRPQNIRIACQYSNKKGRLKEYSFNTKTDTAGYFKLENVPPGKYVLKAVDFRFERASNITLASKFGRTSLGDDGRYWGMMNGMMMDNLKYLLSDHFDVESGNGVIDLGITYILIKANVSSNDAGMGKISPDGRPPWQRINFRDRGSTIDLYLLQAVNLPEMVNMKLGEQRRLYNKPSPAAYYHLTSR